MKLCAVVFPNSVKALLEAIQSGFAGDSRSSSALGVNPGGDVLIHCSGPEEEAEVVGCSLDHLCLWAGSLVR